jgi:predicted enzyme related to lactoylglutathione lyase
MGTRDSYEPGTFCAVDLATTDPDGAKEFYGALFGWEAEDVSPGEGMTYTIFGREGDAVAGMFEQPAESREAGMTPHWISYVSVTDADATAARAAELGGEVVQEPLDILDVGRMAAVQDPTGSGVAVWQAGTFAGAARVNEPGCLTWNELVTNDAAAALDFYRGLFRWSTEEMDTGGGLPYVVIKIGERSNGGVRPLSPEEAQAGIPPHWVPYFATDSLQRTLQRGQELGGGKLYGPAELPDGRIGVMHDPQGATFALWEGQLAD